MQNTPLSGGYTIRLTDIENQVSPNCSMINIEYEASFIKISVPTTDIQDLIDLNHCKEDSSPTQITMTNSETNINYQLYF